VSTLRIQNTELFAKMKQLRENLRHAEDSLQTEKESTQQVNASIHVAESLLASVRYSRQTTKR